MPFYTRAELAVCVVPVADLLGDPLAGTQKEIERAYQHLPMSGDAALVRRIGQILFNDVVTVVQERDSQVRVRVAQQFYCTAQDHTPHHLYWTLKKYLRPLGCFTDLTGIIQPTCDCSVAADVVTLARPWYDGIIGRWYSAGTRFMINPHKKPHRHCVAVYTLAPRGRMQTVHVPESYCVQRIERTPEQKRELFIRILRDIASVSPGCVPYVWGGMSWVQSYGKTFKRTIEVVPGKQPLSKWNSYPASGGVCAGFDCAALVLRAAQIAGFSWCGRNSWAFKHHVKPLDKDKNAQIGDILYIPGHVMVLSSVEQAMLIEARTQAHGYGWVHEIPLSEEFACIKTVADLLGAYREGKSVARLDKEGHVIATVPISILDLSAIF